MDRPKIQKYLEHEKYLLGISTLPDHVEAYVAHITGHRQKYHFKLYLKLIINFFFKNISYLSSLSLPGLRPRTL